MYDNATEVNKEVVVALASVTAGANGSAVDLADYEGKVDILLQAADATAGTSPTLDVHLEESDSGSGDWSDITDGAFTQVEETAGDNAFQAISLDLRKQKRYIRAVHAIGGTSSPEFYFGVLAVGRHKRV